MYSEIFKNHSNSFEIINYFEICYLQHLLAFEHHFSHQSGPIWEPKTDQNRSKIDFKVDSFFDVFFDQLFGHFGDPFGTLLRPVWAPFSHIFGPLEAL